LASLSHAVQVVATVQVPQPTLQAVQADVPSKKPSLHKQFVAVEA